MFQTNAEAIEAVRLGRRAVTETSMHTRHEPDKCPGFNHSWRVIACNDVEDVVECSHCGRQKLARCNFDEEFA